MFFFLGFSEENSHSWAKCEAVLKDCQITKQIFENSHVCHLRCSELNLMHFSTIDTLNVLRCLDDNSLAANLSVLLADESHSDLQTAIYEGV